MLHVIGDFANKRVYFFSRAQKHIHVVQSEPLGPVVGQRLVFGVLF